MLYAIAALFLNAAGRAGVGGFLSTACCNVFLALWFLGFYDWSAFPAVASPFWPVVLLAVFLVLGQGFTILALSLGEVSIVAPVMGVKVILVNILVAVGLREALAPRVWIAAVLSVAGIACLQYNPGKHRRPPHAFSSMACAFVSALFFAAMDVHIQHWAPQLGFERFVPPAMLLGATFSLLFLLPSGGGVRTLSSAARKALVPGGMLLSLQSLLLIFAIVRYGNAAQANIVYSSRGVWSVVFVWLLGHYFANLELKNRSQGHVFSRLTGAVLITLAIILAIDR
jgi:drug/metabolite transporter (DMT)-like permease